MGIKSSINAIIAFSTAILATRLVGYLISFYGRGFTGTIISLNSTDLQIRVAYAIIETIVEVAIGLALFGLLLIRSRKLSPRTHTISVVPWIFLVFSVMVIVTDYFPEILYSIAGGSNLLVIFGYYDLFVSAVQIILPTGILLIGLYYLRRKIRTLFKISYGIYLLGFFSALSAEILAFPQLTGSTGAQAHAHISMVEAILGDLSVIPAVVGYILFIVALLINYSRGPSISDQVNRRHEKSQEEDNMVVLEKE